LCLNFVRGGGCYATDGRCLLGLEGSSAKNDDRKCVLHGRFDVWVMQDDRLLISDLGFPSEEPKQCLALGINEQLARQIGGERSQQIGITFLTTERKCLGCEKKFWYSDHELSTKQAQTGRGYLCPNCLSHETEDDLTRKLGYLGYWCG